MIGAIRLSGIPEMLGGDVTDVTARLRVHRYQRDAGGEADHCPGMPSMRGGSEDGMTGIGLAGVLRAVRRGPRRWSQWTTVVGRSAGGSRIRPGGIDQHVAVSGRRRLWWQEIGYAAYSASVGATMFIPVTLRQHPRPLMRCPRRAVVAGRKGSTLAVTPDRQRCHPPPGIGSCARR